MKTWTQTVRRTTALPAALALLFLAGCASTSEPSCSLPPQHNLDAAMANVERALANGCEVYFHSYLDTLLTVAEGDPGSANKQAFSDFLISLSDRGTLSRRQASELYNRYFNIKFVSLMGDYNNCAFTCPRQDKVMDAMQAELGDKERGLLRVALDQDSYYRADRLLQETELVLAATCNACAESR